MLDDNSRKPRAKLQNRVRLVRAARGTRCCSPNDAFSPGPGAGRETDTSRFCSCVSAARSLLMAIGLTGPISRLVSAASTLRGPNDASATVLMRRCSKARQQLARLAMSDEANRPDCQPVEHTSKLRRCGSWCPVGNTCAHAALCMLQSRMHNSCRLLLAVMAAYADICCGQLPAWHRM